MSSSKVWSQYLTRLQHQDLPEPVYSKTRLHLIDTLAAIISGFELPAGQAGLRLSRRLAGPPEATVFSPTVFKVGGLSAACANAMAAHADETDDSHLRGRFHPGCSIVPTALACAEIFEANIADLMASIAAGYDIGARAVLALGIPEHEKPRFSTHTIGGQWGAAATAIALAGLSEDQAQWALSYTAQQVSGVPYWRKDRDHIEKSFDFGAMAARNALFAVTVVQEGWTGCSDVLEGAESYLSAFAHQAKAQALTDGLGQRFEIEAATIKKWCVGSPIQSVLDSTHALMGQHGVRAEQIERIVITMPDDRIHIVDNRDMPDVCVQHLVAVALLDGAVGFRAAHDKARMHDPAVLALRQKIALQPSAELTQARPARQAIVEILLGDGQALKHHTVCVLGTPENPMSEDQVHEKALDLLVPVIGVQSAQRLVRAFQPADRHRRVRDVLNELFVV